MNMEIIKKYKGLFVLGLVVIAGVSLFYRFYQNDTKTLTGFFASYEKFDKAISDFSIGEAADLESKAGDAFIELDTKAAAFRLSSLVENDAELMEKAPEIADISEKELDNLRAYKRAILSKSVDLDGFAKEYGDLTSKRKTAYARFRELAGLKD